MAARKEKIKRLGRELRVFGEMMRRTLGTADAGALLRAFPVSTEMPNVVDEPASAD